MNYIAVAAVALIAYFIVRQFQIARTAETPTEKLPWLKKASFYRKRLYEALHIWKWVLGRANLFL